MAGGSHHCKDCGLYFESARSLEVHLQYHKENLMNMWMGSEERGREGGAPAPSPVQGDLTPLGVSSSDGLVSSSVQSVNAGVSSSSFTVPSPMQYEYKMSPGLQSPQGGVVPQGPPSGHGLTVGFPQQSPGGFYGDFGQQHHHHQPQQPPQQFGGYQIGGFLNGGFDDGFYGRGASTAPRFHPYMGRSPAPTPSPGNPHTDIKEEMPSADTPEILDLDSQKVLGSSVPPQSQQQSGPLPPMWRPHEQFPSPGGLTMGGLSPMQTGYPGPPAPPQHIPGLGGGSSYLSSGGGMGGYHPQGMTSTPQAMSSPSSMFGAPPPSPRETAAPPSEFASNVKRPKSFKCEDCNKWFTSHGHLKRHYNTTLHKNMTKVSGNSANRSTPDHTRPPILSPGAKSIGEASNLSSQDEESNLSAADALETPPPPPMQQPPPSYNPPTSLSGYQPPGVPGPSQGLHPAAQFNQAPHFLGGEQPPTAPTLYHGHFSTNPTGFGSQPPTSMGGGPPFYPGSGSNNFGGYQTQGGHQGPGFHSMNDFPGPSLDGFSSFKLENDRVESAMSRSPEPAGGDTGSEASMDSSESGGTSSSVNAEGSFRCQDCSKLFNRMCYLTQHRTTYHEGEKPFKCGTCGKRFPDEVTFNDHQSKHAGDKPYKCEVCPKQFNHKTDLRRHMCLHTGEKPFTCEQCGKGFIRKDHMLKHFQTHRKKAMAAAASVTPSHPPQGPPMNHGPPVFPGHHPGHRPGGPHGGMTHPGHGPPGHPGHPPHVVAPPVY